MYCVEAHNATLYNYNWEKTTHTQMRESRKKVGITSFNSLGEH